MYVDQIQVLIKLKKHNFEILGSMSKNFVLKTEMLIFLFLLLSEDYNPLKKQM